MEKRRLIALDLDGTLLDQNRKISAKNQAAIDRAKALGIPVVLCSGRYHAGVRLIAKMAGVHDVLVCGNGAQVTTAAGEDIVARYMSLGDTRHLAALAQLMKLPFSVYADNMLYSAWMHDTFRYYKANECPVKHLDTPFPTQVDENSRILKIEIHGRFTSEHERQLRQCIDALGTVVGEGDFLTSVECHVKDVSKGTGLAAAAAYYGIPLKNTLAVGNAENDLSMLETAGYAVAVDNAVDELKAIADHIAPDHEHDGVAEAIDWFLRH